MKRYRIFVVCLGLVVFAMAFVSYQRMTSTEAEPSLVSVSWDPPKSSVDTGYVQFAKALLGNGLGDPRGGKFSRVKVNIGDAAWNFRKSIDGLGWVLPDGKHAVLMDGLTYPIEASVGPVDIDRTMAELSVDRRVSRSPIGVQELTDATPALLLLAGRSDLAEKAFKVKLSQYPDYSAYALGTWMHQRFQMQVAEALKDHKDDDGLFWARQLLTVSKVEEREKVTTRFPQHTPPTSDLATSRDIYLDMVRRVKNPKPAKIDLVAVRKLDDKRRIAFYIDNLDEIEGTQFGQPGGVDFSQDPLYQAIVADGTETVPALIDVLEHDKRYTRTVSFGRDFFPSRSIHSVKSIALSLLNRVWPSSSRWGNDNPAMMAESLRKAWGEESALNEPERWARVLADDQSNPRDWLQACQYLVSPSDEVRMGSMVRPSTNPQAPMKGEALRESRGPELAALMAKRAIQVARTDKTGFIELTQCADALRMGHCLAKWAPDLSRQTLASLSKRALELIEANASQGGLVVDYIAVPFGQLTSDRIQLGDHSSVRDYAQGVTCFAPTSWIKANAFRPFWSLPKDSEMQAIAKKYMDGEAALLMSPDPKEAARPQFSFVETTIYSPLLAISSYRRMLATGIGNTVLAGEGWLENAGGRQQIKYKFSNGTEFVDLYGVNANQPIAKHIDVSVGDFLAQSLLKIKGAPPFCMIWEPSKRQEGRQALKQWLLDDHRDWLAVAKTSGFYNELFWGS